jgi:membrane-bound metal-dependent hydrolase YbcI (DUF457 family)
MIIIVSIAVCYFIFSYFKFIESNFIKHGVIIGLSWFVIHVFFDIMTLMPMMRLDFKNYFKVIGLRYTIIPVISITVGYLLNLKYKEINNP